MRPITLLAIQGTTGANETLYNSANNIVLNGGLPCNLKKILVAVNIQSAGSDVIKTLRPAGMVKINGQQIPISECSGQVDIDISGIISVTASLSLTIEFVLPIISDLDYDCQLIAFIE